MFFAVKGFNYFEEFPRKILKETFHAFKTTLGISFPYREKDIAKELQKSNENSQELEQQLKEAIQQKVKLSKQLEDWQVRVPVLLDQN